MNKKDWNPDLYLKFNKERIQPSIDLVSRIDYENPNTIIDIGCGPGNSAQILLERWPNSKITGVDNSQNMIEKAKATLPDLEWKLLDVSKDKIPGKYDIVFSNATIQWIPDHPGLLKRLKGNLTDNGIIAVQIPLFFDMPLGKSISKISKESRWSDLTVSVNDLFTIHSYFEYYDYLSELFSEINIWVTDYIHVMDSHNAILEMIRSSGLRPYLDKLESDADKKDFEDEVFENIKKDYPIQKNGKVLFSFKRLFFIANK